MLHEAASGEESAAEDDLREDEAEARREWEEANPEDRPDPDPLEFDGL